VLPIALGQNLKAASSPSVVTDDSPTAAESARRSLARYELAAIRQRNVVRMQLGLGDDELTTLLYLQEHSRVTQGELVALSTLTRSGVGAMVHRLEEAGLIERLPDPGDKRRRLLQLSARGARRMRDACGACDDEVGRLLAERPDEELHALTRMLRVVAETTRIHADASNGEPDREPEIASRDWSRWG
jgi:DNA-binding MarR family transcriptional regulator